MLPRLDPYSVSPRVMQELISFQEFLQMMELDAHLIELVRVRVSQINGCPQGVSRHTRGACALGESAEKLAALRVWRSAPYFTERERAALNWAEAVTLVSQAHVPDVVFDKARQWFTEAEVVKLTLVIAATNAWNRVESSFLQHSARTPDTQTI